MVVQRLEICIELLKMVIQFVIDFVGAVGSVVNQTNSAVSDYPIQVPYVGILP